MAEPLTPQKLVTRIAKAIRKADKRYWFEDYTIQAEAVVKALAEAGYGVVPLRADEEMRKAGADAIPIGRQHPTAVARFVYDAMAELALNRLRK